MTKHVVKSIVLVTLLLAGARVARAQPTASPALLAFTYQVNSTPYPAGKLTATLPKSLGSGYTLTASVNSSTTGWLTVTPDSGASPLALTVTLNPTGLNPGSYTGTITLGTNPPSTTSTVPVSLSVSNPPSALIVSPPTPLPKYYTTGATAALTFNYTTGTPATDFVLEELDVASNGGIIPFTVVAAAGGKSSPWLRVNVSNQVPNLQTSGVVLAGSYVPIYASIDFTVLSALDVGFYAGTITFTNNTTAATVVVNVNLNISAGDPTIGNIFPNSVIAAPPAGRVPPVVTIYGDNFFTTSEVTLTPSDTGIAYPNLKKSLLSRKVLQATLDPAYLVTKGAFTLTVANPKTIGSHDYSIAFNVDDPAIAHISSIVNAASYLPAATQTGSAADPVSAGNISASPREIIAIFGQNLGPHDVTQVPATTGNFPNFYPSSATTGTVPTTYTVIFSFGADPTCVGTLCSLVAPAEAPAPLIMISNNQINAIVPRPPAVMPPIVVPAGGLPSWVQVTETTVPAAGPATTIATNWLPITILPDDPGVFTFGGLGQGQAAVLNYNASTGYSINSAKNQAAKGSTISLYATGMGDLMSGALVTVTDASSTPRTASMNFPIVVNPSRAAPATAPAVSPIGTLPGGVQNSPYTPFTLQAAAGTPPYVWSVTGLPPGMSLNLAGLLTGTPGVAAAYNPTFTLIDSSSPKQSASASLSLTISPENISITPLKVPDGVQGAQYTPTTLVATGGTPPYVWSAVSLLPPGLSLSGAGILAGTPSTANVTPYSFPIQVQDSASPPVTQAANYSMAVNLGMAIITPTLPDGSAGVPYTASLGVQGGIAPYIWSPIGLPAGLTIDAKGVVSGIPSSPFAGVVVVKVSDNSLPPFVATNNYAINISAAVQITPTTLPAPATILYQYEAFPAQTMQAFGGTPPYTWSAAGLPPGLVLDRKTGVLSGVPLTQVSLPLMDGAVSLGAVYLNDNSYRVEIDGQPAVTSYAGASQGSVAGLVQINAVVPPTARTGPSIPLTISIGTATGARRSQLGVTLAVK